MGAERIYPRADVNLEVRYQTGHETGSAYAKQLGGGGLFLETVTPLALNQEVHLCFSLPGIVRPFELKGLVVWTNPFASRAAFPTGMGIKFLELDPQQRTILDDFVHAKLAKASPRA